ncbi:acetyltransferase, GNAT family protein [Tritrichomonas foetus]|uniref:Acetyltransferase, GNAT family protein n=1 Tax=Tritrichomonas foetus TaxID=1144522 RepID=A0A1J4K600_9EUKA|nr:acetyltransferase, GNAT family protein [Tritrichomonas foetus]|eukprot:OHT06418.1 acetyltransferase, GNAT family protein [Tritrichomonas foetus]
MVSIQPWSLEDIWRYSRVNIDEWTETYSIPFYLYYTLQWPQLAWTVSNNSNDVVGYILGSAKTEDPSQCKGHVTAVTVCEDYRRLGIASLLMKFLENTADKLFRAYFVDLYVRPTNKHAQTMYEKLGYVLYRQITNYYETLNEDGYDMRKSLPRDREKKFSIPLDHPVTKDEVGWD